MTYLLGREGRIVLQTRKGTQIENHQVFELSQLLRNVSSGIEQMYQNAEKRSNPSGIYNCHGLTFASRRCYIDKPEEVMKMLADDDYIEVERIDVQPGDIIVYFSNGDVEHSGIVIEHPNRTLYNPLVLSKWAYSSEFIHRMAECPYDCTNIRFYRIIE